MLDHTRGQSPHSPTRPPGGKAEVMVGGLVARSRVASEGGVGLMETGRE